MLSDVDLRDWDRTIAAARDAVGRLNPNCPLDAPIEGSPEVFLMRFIDKAEALVVSNDKQIAALFKAKS